MKIFPAIDLFEKKAVRLYKGDYEKMTVYNDNPVKVAEDFKSKGAEWIHLVDLEGALNGQTPNLDTVESIVKESGLKAEIGGGIRSMEVIEKYLSIGVKRVILGTSAVTDRMFLENAVKKHGEKIAVGVDIKDGFVAIKGWTEKSQFSAMQFCKDMQELGIKTIICTDISKDGAMQGTNHALYKELVKELDIDIIASGGVSSMNDIVRLKEQNVYGAIIGKAYYTGAINLEDAIKVAHDN
ncbi:MAG: 1-(5-phosphoribosyl)-5-[Clostridia bacterium]|nr:1-(5-phosphoribosyl)-5-[(5-phosphoribosylamino)methylideneamino]imidazole-4-carboxamide isomerase [Clostridia bacterium]